MIDTAPKLKMSYPLEEHVYPGSLEFEMPFPTAKKKMSKMMVRLQDQPTKVSETVISLWPTSLCNTELG